MLSQYQHFCIQYRYQWKSTVFGTSLGTKAKHANEKTQKMSNINAILNAYLKLCFKFFHKSYKYGNSKQVSPKFDLSFN